MLLALSGTDACGKTTLAKRLASEHGFRYVKRPDRSTDIGQILDQFIKGKRVFNKDPNINEHAAQLLFGANNLDGMSEMMDALDAGANLVCDRYVADGVVYHSQAVGKDRREFIEGLNAGMPKPDLHIVLEVPYDIAQARLEQRGDAKERNDNPETHAKVTQGFRDYFPDAVFIDASGTPDEVLGQVMEAMAKHELRNAMFYDGEGARLMCREIY